MKEMPNIVLFIVDQLMPMMTGAYGHPSAITPHIDRLAQEGVTFDTAYSTVPVCVPARASLLSGNYVATTGCYDNGGILPADIPTHNHYLNIAGYDTALSGKAHFVGPDQLHGFQKRFLTNIYPSAFKFLPHRDATMGPENLHPNPIAVDYLEKNLGVRQFSMELECDEDAMRSALIYLSGKRSQMSGSAQLPIPPQDERPFFLQLSLNHPHEPFHVLQQYWDRYEGVEVPIPQVPADMEPHLTSMDRTLNAYHGSDRIDVTDPDNLRALHRAYLAAVSYVDDKLGEFRQMLRDFGLEENTVILFMSDHGDMIGHRGMVQKRYFYEQSSRIPAILYTPPRYRRGTPGKRVKSPVSIIDIAPTILDLAGITGYEPMDGASLLPLADGEEMQDRFVFCENYSEGFDKVAIMIRKGEYKYTYIHGTGERQLFNIEDDPLEWKNLATDPKQRETCARLDQIILARFDPEEIDRKAQQSYRNKKVVQESILKTGGSPWNFHPKVDADNMYWRD